MLGGHCHPGLHSSPPFNDDWRAGLIVIPLVLIDLSLSISIPDLNFRAQAIALRLVLGEQAFDATIQVQAP